MGQLNILLIKYADKVLCVVLLAWAGMNIFDSVMNLSVEPEISVNANKTISTVKKADPAPPKFVKPKMAENFKEELVWKPVLDKTRSPFFRYESVDITEAHREYEKKKIEHEKEHSNKDLLFAAEDRNRYCIFPGCDFFMPPEKNYIGKVEELQVVDTTVMNVSLKWLAPSKYIDAKLTHCTMQKRKKGEELWKDVLDNEGQVLRILGSYFQEEQEEVVDESTGPEGFQFSGITSEPEALQEDEQEDLEDEPLVRDFAYLDFNLEAGTEYEYRVKAWGISTVPETAGQEIEGDGFCKAIVAKTTKDRGMRFTRYIPGYRNEKGQLVKREGKVVSPDKVYVNISVQFLPPWSPKRYMMDYLDRGIVIGDPEKSNIGRVQKKHTILLPNGNRVYYSKRLNEFRHKAGKKAIEALDGYVPDLEELTAEEEARKINSWKVLQMDMDFLTDWDAVKVDEQVDTINNIERKFNPTLRDYENIERKTSQYRYFLIIKHRKTGQEEKLELERENHTIRLLNSPL
ncbi:MAG: hypothetical protein HQL32_13555 [Planctomycetes bacterium]|nr:hypothetical protein [Planctomycetota bacterium]